MLLPVRPLQGEKAAQIDRRFAHRQRIPSRSMTVADHITLGVFVVFVEGHIQEMPDGAAGIDRRRKFGDVIDDVVIGVEQTATGKNSAERAANRLAHGEDDVRRRGVHAVVVPLGRDPSAPEHDERVGTRGAQRLSQGGRVAVMVGEADMSDLFQRHFEARRITSCRNVGGRDQPAHIAKTPGAERRLAPVRKRHQSVRRRWKIVHQIVGRHWFSHCFLTGYPSANRSLFSER